jgi:hypothetical protein
MNQARATRHNLPLKILLALIAFALCCLLIGYEYLMFQWPMVREAHFLHYIAYLINEHDFVPYKDVLETSWFGTFLFHMAIGKLFGYSASEFRTADIIFLLGLLSVTWGVLRRLDTWLAWVGSSSFGLTYLHYGPANSLQRDYVLLLPITTGLLVALQTDWRSPVRAFIIGVCFGAATSIKPHSIIGLPVILALLYSQSGATRSILPVIFYCGLGGICTMSLGLFWLWHVGGLAAFIDMTLHYLPLYQDFNGAHEMWIPAERWHSTLRWWKYFLWNWPTAILVGFLYGWINTDKNSQERAILLSLIMLTICYNIYPLISGKFWDYHWIPYSYFAVLSTSILLFPARDKKWRGSLLSLCAILFFLHTLSSQYLPGRGIQDQIRKYPDITISQKIETDIAAFITQHLKPGETIQPIDQGGPSTIYLLKANAVLATPYLGSFMFLHHINQPYVQKAQKNFLQLLNEKPPALILFMTDFTKPSGADTITEIPGLNDFLTRHYRVIRKDPLFTFWEYNDQSTSRQELP